MTAVDVAVMEEFGVWFRTLRGTMRKKLLRGHTNPTVILMSESSRAGASAAVEVVDAFSHVLRLEELHRSSLEDAESQWRQFLSRSGSLPRGPAAVAARIQRQLQQHDDKICQVVQSESAMRASLVGARDRWISEVGERAQYELQYLANYAAREIRRRLVDDVLNSVHREELTHRRALEQVAVSWFSTLAVAARADVSQIAQECSSRASQARHESTKLVSLVEHESVTRATLSTVENNHRRLMHTEFLNVYDALRQTTQQRMLCRDRVIIDGIACIDDMEQSQRRALESVAATYFRDIEISARQILTNMATSLRQQAANEKFAVGAIDAAVHDLVCVSEPQQRLKIAEAYVRWVSEVANKERVVIQASHIRESQLRHTKLARIRVSQQELLMAEARERDALARSAVEWVRLHFVPLEAIDRIEIPDRIAQREALHRAAAAAQRIRVVTPQDTLMSQETQVRQKLIFSEIKWRASLSVRWDHMTREYEPVSTRAAELLMREEAAREAVVGSEAHWRRHTAQLFTVGAARLAAASSPVSNSKKKHSLFAS